MKAFIVVSFASWVANDFEPHIDKSQWQLIRDYGFDTPRGLEKYDSVAWWMNAQHAARLQRVGVATTLSAPGSAWLSTLDESLLGRTIHYGAVADFLSLPSDYSFWVKPAEAKIDGFEAGWRTVEDTQKVCSELSIPSDSHVQWTDSLLKLNDEHRFHVLDGKVVTGSAYLVNNVTYYDGAVSDKSNEAKEFASFVTETLSDNQPEAYTLDVAFDEISNKWILLEGNPAWCSGIYGSEPDKALAVIEKSCYNNYKTPEFLWKPDSYLKGIAERKVPLR